MDNIDRAIAALARRERMAAMRAEILRLIRAGRAAALREVADEQDPGGLGQLFRPVR